MAAQRLSNIVVQERVVHVRPEFFGNLASAGAAAGSVNEDAVLAVLAKIAINGRDLLDSRLQAPWLRVLGEIHYAQANYAVSVHLRVTDYCNVINQPQKLSACSIPLLDA